MRNITGVLILSLLCSTAPAQQRLQVVVLEGANGVGNVGRRAPDVLVEIQDQDKKPVDGAHVSMILPDRGVGGAFMGGRTVGSDRTGSDGRVRFGGVHLRSLTGEFPIRLVATRNGDTASATVTQRVEEGASQPNGRWSGRNLAMAIIAGAGVAAGIVAATYGSDKGPNPTGFIVNPGTPVVAGPR